MKNSIYFFVCLLICFSACHKKDKGEAAKKCNSALFAVNNTPQRVVSIDTGTGKISDIPAFQDVRGAGCFNREEKCYYVLQTDDNGFINLLKMDLVTKKTTTYKGPRFSSNYFRFLRYSSQTSKFYSANTFSSRYTYDWSFYEITISSDTLIFNDIYFSDKGFLAHPIVSNEENGELYFQTGDGMYTFIPLTREISHTAFPIEKQKELRVLQYNTKDGYLYAIYGDFATGSFRPQSFVKVNPKTGSVDKFNTILPEGVDGSAEGSIDVCNNSYIVHASIVEDKSVYWFDMKSGVLSKKLTLDEQVSQIMCINIE